ncbi:MAG: SGNH/GDSL hydrolase family protein [Acidimicrobiales bacterium]
MRPSWLIPTASITLALAGFVALGPVRSAAAPRPAYYLDLGASVSVGEQPTTADPRGEPTGQGFADDLVGIEAQRGVDLQLVRLGCPGETTLEMISGDRRCFDPPDSQLAAAVAFLKDHVDEPGLVTLDIGFDDVAHCLEHETVDVVCVDSGLDSLGHQLRYIVDTLRRNGGPETHLLGVGAYDPFLADWGSGAQGQGFAADSARVMTRLNDELSAAYRAEGVSMVDVAAAFSQDSADSPDGLSSATMADEAALTCELTWMCAAPPLGPNFHPNDDGYGDIADAIAAALPSGL